MIPVEPPKKPPSAMKSAPSAAMIAHVRACVEKRVREIDMVVSVVPFRLNAMAGIQPEVSPASGAGLRARGWFVGTSAVLTSAPVRG
jgi:hypothetical protein